MISPGRHLESGAEGGPLSPVFIVEKDVDLRIVQGFQQLPGPVSRSVVDQDDLFLHLLGPDFSPGWSGWYFLVIYRDDDR